jgi:murein DD-endopeptidase MepM/ murein hydrolase activator NlpD
VLTPRLYQQHWLDEYDRQLVAVDDGGDAGAAPSASCVAGGSDGLVVDGYAYPGPADLFASAPVDAPHHDYPAWDWGLPVGTPIYAVRGGRVVSVQNWPHNWWDYGCGRGRAGCQPCGIGVTIEDDTGTRWGYCHASAVHVTAGDVIDTGANILTSGNSGRSSGPHLHLQIRTPDGQLRCPQPLLRALLDGAAGVDPAALPTSGCTY